MTVSSDVLVALQGRLATITAANGYATDVQKIFYPLGVGETQPMGADIPEHQMPAVIMYAGPAPFNPEHHLVSVHAQVYLELVNKWVPDAEMWTFVADVGKAIFGGSSGATENGAYRFHPAVAEPKITEVVPDFGMLPAHRIWVVALVIHYRVRYTNL